MIFQLFSLSVRALVVAAVLPTPSALGAASAPTVLRGPPAVAAFSFSNTPVPAVATRADAILPPAAGPAGR